MIKFGDSSAITYYILNLLNTQYIPTIPVVSQKPEKNSMGYILNKYLVDTKGEIVSEYTFGERYLNISQNYDYNPGFYSTELHEYLGKYLRAYTNYYKIDLMNFYNCFSNRFINTFSLPVTHDSDAGKVVIPGYQESTILTCFPIVNNLQYKLKFYSNNMTNIKVQPILFNGNTLISNKLIFESKNYTVSKGAEITLSTADFNYTAFGEDISIDDYAKYLYLAIQFENSSEIPQLVVLEQPQYTLALNNSLLNLNVNYNVPFSDKLIEYLTGNVITPLDNIKQNIRRLQLIVLSGDFKEKFDKDRSDIVALGKIKGYYSEELRSYLYNILYKYCNNQVPPIVLKDYLGYIDKDVEELLLSCVTPELNQKLMEV